VGVPPRRFILDLHNHTHHSHDGVMSPLELLQAAAAAGVDCVGVTDHGTTRGGLEAAALAEADPDLPRVIVGQETFTTQGEVIGLYVADDVPTGLTFAETVAAIRRQGGLVYLPHPYDALRRATVHAGVVEQAAAAADIIEVENGRSLRRSFNRSARRLAARHGRAGGGGSDAHYAGELGRAVSEVSRMPERGDLVALLHEGRSRSREGPAQSLLSLWFLVRVGVDKVRTRLDHRLRG
jgi:predicted metal-dependent phosphoesterase TrpH